MGTRSGFSCLNVLSNLSLDVIPVLLSTLGPDILSHMKCGGLQHPLLSRVVPSTKKSRRHFAQMLLANNIETVDD